VPIASLPSADADVLSGMTFAGSPLHVYLAFVPIADGDGDALAIVSLYPERRVELRILRGGAKPLYAIFPLYEGAPP
jgi:hypothetical protein